MTEPRYYAPLGWMDGQGCALKHALGYGDYMGLEEYAIAKAATVAIYEATGDDGVVE